MEALRRLRKKQEEQRRSGEVDQGSSSSDVKLDENTHVQFVLSSKGEETVDLLADHGSLRALLSDILETRSFQLQLREGIAKVPACDIFASIFNVATLSVLSVRAGPSYIADQCHRVG
jgi:hypothetical protein